MVGIGIVIFDLDAILSEIVGQDSFLVIIAFIISVLFSFVMAGYSLNVLKNGIDNSIEIPEFDFANNFVDGIKLLVIYIVYFIIPTVITIALLFIFGAIEAGLDKMVGSLGIWTVVAVILFIIFGIFGTVAQARFAMSNSIGNALSIGEVFDDVKRIGIVKILIFLIVVSILLIVYGGLLGIVTVVPIIGTIIIDILLGAFIFLFVNYGIGLLYSE